MSGKKKTARRSGLKWWDIEETVLAIRAVRNKERAVPCSFEEIRFSSFYVVEHPVTNGHEILGIRTNYFFQRMHYLLKHKILQFVFKCFT
jgi:hypothetical protein